MASKINADTTDGLKIESDLTGNIDIQNNDSTVVSVTSSGASVTGTLSATGNVSTPGTITASSFSGDGSSLTNIPAANLTGSLPAGMGGKILQVVSTVRSGEFTTTSGSFVDVTGITATITPSSTSSKIYISMSTTVGDSAGAYAHMRVLRNGTAIGLGATPNGNASGVSFVTQGYQSTNQCLTIPFTYLDSPATTSALTYKLQTKTFAGRIIYINRTPDVGDGNVGKVATSSITLFEIGA